MSYAKINPFVRTAGIYEVINNNGECKAYDSRLIYIISGDLTANIDGEKKRHLTAGNLIYIPAGVSYKLKAQYIRAVVIAFDPTDDFCDESDFISPSSPECYDEKRRHTVDIEGLDKVLFCADMEGERETFIHLCSIATGEEGLWREVISAEVKLLLLKLLETVSENALPIRMVEALDDYISENVGEEISNTEIGAIFGYHPFYVSKMLKDKKGVTLRQYIIAHRLKTAKQLLRFTKRSIAEIADETGFTDASYFTKTFRTAFGVTPKEWRAKFKEEFI